MANARHKPLLSVGSPSGRSYVNVRLSRRTIWNVVWVSAVVALVAFGAVMTVRQFFTKPVGSIGTTYELQPGPWGKVTAQPILIEAPPSMLTLDFRLGDGRWYFRARTPDEVAAFLRGKGLAAEQTSRILAALQPVAGQADLFAAAPPEDLVRSLSTEVRSSLYDALANVPENFAQVEPFRTTDLHLDAWFGDAKLPPDLIKEVHSLMWRRGSGLFFSDYNIVADRISSPVLKLELLAQLTHKASVVLTLHVPAGGKVDELVAYYGVNGRREKVEPVLKALSEAGGGTIGFSNMLPAFARSRLYRFADPLPGKDVTPDCHWTTFNFFTQGAPDDLLSGTAHVAEVLEEKYEPVAGRPRFGDVVLLMLPDGSSIHSATYIADDIVYTKNGMSPASPFIFSTIEDMLAFYPNSESIRLAYRRLKGS